MNGKIVISDPHQEVTYRGIKIAKSVALYSKNGTLRKRISESIEKLADLLIENDHALLSEYVKNGEKVLIDFKCGHVPHWITPDAYKTQGQGCPKCGKQKIKAARQEFSKQSGINFAKLVRKNQHKLLSEYEDAHKKVLIDFKCGHGPHWITTSHYRNDHGCPKCTKKCPVQAEENLEKLIKENGHELLSTYSGNKKKVRINFRCGHKPHTITPADYNSGYRCPLCAKEKRDAVNEQRRIKDKEEFIEIVEKNNHKLLSEYEKSSVKVLINFHCGHEPSWVSPGDYKDGHRCLACAGHSPFVVWNSEIKIKRTAMSCWVSIPAVITKPL